MQQDEVRRDFLRDLSSGSALESWPTSTDPTPQMKLSDFEQKGREKLPNSDMNR